MKTIISSNNKYEVVKGTDKCYVYRTSLLTDTYKGEATVLNIPFESIDLDLVTTLNYEL